MAEGWTVGAEAVLTLARAAAACTPPRTRQGGDPIGAAFEAVVDAMPHGDERRALVADLAAARPDLVLYRAGDWVSDVDVDVLLHLPEPWLRLAVAGAVRPWRPEAIDEMRRRLGDESAAETLAAVMADRHPTLNRPSGFSDEPDRRWVVIGAVSWEWTLWRSDDGRHALEVVVSSGHADFFVSELVDGALIEEWRRNGPATLDADVLRIRDGMRPRP